MKAEVGILNRNIVIQGNPDDSIDEEYGGHFIIDGRSEEGTIAKLNSLELRYTG